MSPLAQPGEPFADVCRRLNVVSRIIGAAEWVSEGNYNDAIGLLLDLEDELRLAIEQNELADEMRAAA